MPRFIPIFLIAIVCTAALTAYFMPGDRGGNPDAVTAQGRVGVAY